MVSVTFFQRPQPRPTRVEQPRERNASVSELLDMSKPKLNVKPRVRFGKGGGDINGPRRCCFLLFVCVAPLAMAVAKNKYFFQLLDSLCRSNPLSLRVPPTWTGTMPAHSAAPELLTTVAEPQRPRESNCSSVCPLLGVVFQSKRMIM
jgi:hypothetical protein